MLGKQWAKTTPKTVRIWFDKAQARDHRIWDILGYIWVISEPVRAALHAYYFRI